MLPDVEVISQIGTDFNFHHKPAKVNGSDELRKYLFFPIQAESGTLNAVGPASMTSTAFAVPLQTSVPPGKSHTFAMLVTC